MTRHRLPEEKAIVWLQFRGGVIRSSMSYVSSMNQNGMEHFCLKCLFTYYTLQEKAHPNFSLHVFPVVHPGPKKAATSIEAATGTQHGVGKPAQPTRSQEISRTLPSSWRKVGDFWKLRFEASGCPPKRYLSIRFGLVRVA